MKPVSLSTTDEALVEIESRSLFSAPLSPLEFEREYEKCRASLVKANKRLLMAITATSVLTALTSLALVLGFIGAV